MTYSPATCIKLIMTVLLALMVAGCCSAKEKKEVGERIEKRIQEMRENCALIEDQAMRDQCYADINPLIESMENKYLDYLAACAAGNTDLAKQILEQLRQLLAARRVVVTAAGQVVNDQFVLFRDDLVWCDITALHEFVVVPLDLVEVDGMVYLPDAAGNLSINRTSLSENEDTLELQILRADWETNYERQYVVNGPLSIEYDGITIAGTVSGELWLTPQHQMGDSLRSVPSRMTLTLSSDALTFDLGLVASSPFNELVVEPDGTGTLRVFTQVRYHAGQELPPLRPYTIWVTIPVVANANWSAIQLTTGTDWMRGTDIMPVGPFPVADFDNNGVVNQDDFVAFMDAFLALDPASDVNYDGVVDQDDFDYFHTYWQYEMEQ